MKVALVHDFLTQKGGAEKVLEVFHEIYSDAPIYVLFADKDKFSELPRDLIKTSFLQKYPFIKSKYRWYLSLMPTAIESLDLSNYDVVLSSVSAFAKGIITKENSVHISYCHTPTRYLWSDAHSYLKTIKLPLGLHKYLPFALSKIRLWDRLASDRVDYFIANSKLVQKRIKKYYKRDSAIIYPPVEFDKFYISKDLGNYFLAGGRLVAYKKIDLIVKAFNRLGLPLWIYGTGPEMKNLQKMAKSNIKFLGYVPSKELPDLYSKALAYIQPQIEDFGITAVEAMASGRPVLAYRAGGSLETVKEGLSGEFFDYQDWASLADLVVRFDKNKYNPQEIRNWAEQFSKEHFKEKIKKFVREKYNEYIN